MNVIQISLLKASLLGYWGETIPLVAAQAISYNNQQLHKDHVASFPNETIS